MPWLYKIWPHNGYNHIRAKQKFLKKRKGACKSSWSQIGSLKSLALTILWKLEKLVKICPGILVRPHHTDRKQMGLPTEQCEERKKGHLRWYGSPVWTMNGGRILWSVIAFCETFNISCPMGRHHMCEQNTLTRHIFSCFTAHIRCRT